MTRNILIALGAGLLVTGTLFLAGSGEEGHTYTALAIADCAQAKIDDAAGLNVKCESGSVIVPVKWSGELPVGYELVEPGNVEEVAFEDLAAPVPQAPEPTTCIAGKVRKDTSEANDGSQWRTWDNHVCCEMARCQCWDGLKWVPAATGITDKKCAPASRVEIAGRETWPQRLLEATEAQAPP